MHEHFPSFQSDHNISQGLEVTGLGDTASAVGGEAAC